MYDQNGKIADKREFLKIKIKSLAEESRIIRREEGRCRGYIKDELHAHRVGVVRKETRDTNIAYGLIRGKTYQSIERPGKDNPPDWKNVHKMYVRYGPVGYHGSLDDFKKMI